MENSEKEIENIKSAIPDSYTEENLKQLEIQVTRYHDFLKTLATQGYNFEYYTERIDFIEKEMFGARFGTSENQRENSFFAATSRLKDDLERLGSI